jgi:hypothetical protein
MPHGVGTAAKRRAFLFLLGLLIALSVTACAYFAARFSLQSFRDRGLSHGVKSSVTGFRPTLGGMAFRDVVLHYKGGHECFVVAPEVRTHGWIMPDAFTADGAEFHFFGPWYSVPSGTLVRASFSDEAGALRFTCEAVAPDLFIDHTELHDTMIRLGPVRAVFSGAIDDERGVASIDDGRIDVAGLVLPFKIARSMGAAPGQSELVARLDDAPGPALAGSLFAEALQGLGGPSLTGHLSLSVTARLDEEKPETTTVKAQVRNSLALENLPEAYALAPLRDVFRWPVMDAYGGSVQHESGPGTKDWVRVSNLPPHVTASTIMCMDPQFIEHRGFSDLALSVALTDRLLGRRRAGGYYSLSQRLAAILWPMNGPPVRRAIETALLATHLENHFSKEEIVDLFLNVAPWGQKRFGLRDAARFYFDKAPEELLIEESAFIAVSMATPRRIAVDEFGFARRDAKADTIDLLRALNRSGVIADERLRQIEASLTSTAWPLRISANAHTSDAGPLP